MTPEELSEAIKAVDPEMDRITAELTATKAAADEAIKSGDGVKAREASQRFRMLDADFQQVSSTLETLGDIARSMKDQIRVDPQIVYSEAVESRLEIKKLRNGTTMPNGEDFNDWQAEMAALVDAKSFYWAPMMVSVVKVSADALPTATVIEPEMFPVKAGWWWFGKDNAHLIAHGLKCPRRVAALGWLLRDDNRAHVWAFSADWPELGDRRLRTVWNCWLELGRTLNDISIEAQNSHDVGELDDIKAFQRFLFAGLLFIRQRVLITSNAVIGRGARKRVSKVTHETSLQVVHLRRGELLRGHITERQSTTEFTCQWWVRGHWRQQPYKDGVHPRWIDPYIKGDPDKPMKAPTEKVFAVVR